MAYKLIISDVDGCLTSEGSIPFHLESLERVTEKVRQACQGEHTLPPFTLCTGRPQPYTEVLMKMFAIDLPAICENGAVIYTLADNHARFAPGVTEEKVLGLRAVRAFIETKLLPQHPEAYLQFGKESQISVFSQSPELLTEMVPLIKAFVAEQNGPELDINASHFYLNISLKGIDKGKAIEWLLDHLGLRPEEVAGIGDTVGDLPLRNAVGYFACPSNSQEEIKSVADYVSPFPEAKGVLDILEQLEKIS